MRIPLSLFLSIALATVFLGACGTPQAAVPTLALATAAPAASPTPAAEPTVLEYDLGPAVIAQTLVSGERQSLPYRIQGQIAVPAGRLEPAQQQAFLAAYVSDFFAGVFDAAAPPPAWQAGAPVPQQLYGVPALTALLAPTVQRQELLALDGEKLPSDPAGIVAAATPPLQATMCSPQGEACQLFDYGIPRAAGITQTALQLRWEAPGGELLLALPEGRRDLSLFAAIQLRVVLDGYEAARSGAQALHLELRDAAGGRAEVIVPAETLALQPPPAEVRDADQPSPYLQGNAPLASVRVPLAEFTGADLAQVESLALVFDPSERGALFVTDVDLLR